MIFFIQSNTVNINNYTIKDIPGSTGRLDVISRCILAALLNKDDFELQNEIWVFLKNYGNFIFKPKKFNYAIFPKNELLLTKYFVKIIKNECLYGETKLNPLHNIEKIKEDMVTSIHHFITKGFKIYVLLESGIPIYQFDRKELFREDTLFIIGSQVGMTFDYTQFSSNDITPLSLNNKSYLASSVIRLITVLAKISE
ncbi:MAG: hypothetical protein ACTSU4_10075 [Promethearchaeota archaeon]